MNTRQVVKKVFGRTPEILILLLVLLAGILAFGITQENPELDSNISDNKTDLNVSKYYDNESQVCRSPEINQSNTSELEVCVSNQTTVS